VEYLLNKRGVKDKADVFYIANESSLGDFGVGGLHIKKGGYVTHSRIFTESLYAERGIKWITGAHVKEVGENEVFYEDLAGEEKTVKHDFAMLIPPFSGVGIKACGKNDDDITADLFASNGFMKVDADYIKKPYEEWDADDWPRTYQNGTYNNIFAVGIAFAPPHSISKPMFNFNGTAIFPTPPRTGMPSGVMARNVVFSIIDMMKGKSVKPTHTAWMAKMGAACIASAGFNPFDGTAVSMTMYPIVPDYQRFPEVGRDLKYTSGEIGLAGHWIKHLLHYAFIYKGKANPLWQVIPA
jgi:sulfide:quinone oxidoreductase